jgi:SWI/SNF-related matrix-associated actin-dependent regulator 1 of chromatin subfamily A
MSDVPSDREYISFKISHPTESPVRVQAAWKLASGDVKKATGFLLDPTWSPISVASRELSSRVREIDEATRAQRAAEKEKGKKSLIYANRSILDTRVPATPSPSKPAINLVTPTPASPNSPLTPALKLPQRSRAKKLVINSDSESGAEESGDERAAKNGISLDVFERRALDYLNTSNSDALQELTGDRDVVFHLL